MCPQLKNPVYFKTMYYTRILNKQKKQESFITYRMLFTSFLIESDTLLELLANCCQVGGSFGTTTRLLAARMTLHELSISLSPASIIGSCALCACSEILAGMLVNSLELANMHRLSTASKKKITVDTIFLIHTTLLPDRFQLICFCLLLHFNQCKYVVPSGYVYNLRKFIFTSHGKVKAWNYTKSTVNNIFATVFFALIHK